MKEIHYFYVPGGGELCELPAEEARHAIKVLRLTEGDRIVITDGRGYFYDAEVSCVSSRSCEYSILNKRKAESPWQGHLHLAVAPTKEISSRPISTAFSTSHSVLSMFFVGATARCK